MRQALALRWVSRSGLDRGLIFWRPGAESRGVRLLTLGLSASTGADGREVKIVMASLGGRFWSIVTAFDHCSPGGAESVSSPVRRANVSRDLSNGEACHAALSHD